MNFLFLEPAKRDVAEKYTGTNPARSHDLVPRELRWREVCSYLPWRVRNTWSYMEFWDEASDDWENSPSFVRFLSTTAK